MKNPALAGFFLAYEIKGLDPPVRHRTAVPARYAV